MLAIKFKRVGKKHQASFRIVVMERRSKLRGRFTDDLGWYDPQEKKFNFNKEKALYWIKVGAQPTESIHNLFVRSGVVKERKIAIHKKAKKPAAAGEEKTGPGPEGSSAALAAKP